MLFNWFRPSLPVGAREKAWVEVRMRWLAERFGAERLLRADVILPTDRFFPDHYAPTPELARTFMERVCRYMDIDPSAIRLEVRPDEDMPGAAGMYEPGIIHIAEFQLKDPEALVATLAHELAHDLLLGRKLQRDDEPDLEWVTDLLVVFLGLGVFSANATIRESVVREGHHRWWSASRQGYLPSRTIGYALALFAWVRGENQPAWAEHLRLDASDSVKAGLRYLRKTEESLFRPDTLRVRRSAPSVLTLVDRIQDGPPSACIAAIWELAERGPEAAAAVPVLRERLSDSQYGLRAEAARSLAAIASAATPAIPDLLHALDDTEEEVRAAAAYALGKIGVESETVVPVLAERLEDDEARVRVAAALAISQFGSAAAIALPRMLDALGNAFTLVDYETLDCLVHAIKAIAAEPEAALRQWIDSCEPEVRGPAAALVSRCKPITDPTGGPGAWFGRFLA